MPNRIDKLIIHRSIYKHVDQIFRDVDSESVEGIGSQGWAASEHNVVTALARF